MAKFLKSTVWDKVPEGSTVILYIPEFLYKTVYSRQWSLGYTKTSSIRSAVCIQLPACDRRTDGRTDTGP